MQDSFPAHTAPFQHFLSYPALNSTLLCLLRLTNDCSCTETYSRMEQSTSEPTSPTIVNSTNEKVVDDNIPTTSSSPDKSEEPRNHVCLVVVDLQVLIRAF